MSDLFIDGVWEEREESMQDFRHSASVKSLPHTTVNCASWGRSFRKEGWTETTGRRLWLFHKNKTKQTNKQKKKHKGKTCDTNTHTLGLTWEHLLSAFILYIKLFSIQINHYDIALMLKKNKQNQHKPTKHPVAVNDTCPLEHAVSPSVTVLCQSVSLQNQLANDDSNDKEEHAERHDAGAQAFIPHGWGRHGGGVRSAQWSNLSLSQPVVLLWLRERSQRRSQITQAWQSAICACADQVVRN